MLVSDQGSNTRRPGELPLIVVAPVSSAATAVPLAVLPSTLISGAMVPVR